MAIPADQPAASHAPGARPWWGVVATFFMIAVFAQSVFAGAMLSGFDWARMAHAANGLIVVVATFAAGLVATFMLRRIRNGLKFGSTLLALAAAAFVQFALGRLAAKGANLMWVHVPLGVALIALAGQAVAVARRLGAEE